MIRRLADNVHVSCHCEQVAGEFIYVIRIVYGRSALLTAHRKIPTDVEPLPSLLQLWINALAAEDELRKKRHLAELGPYVPGENIELRLRRTKELDDQHFAALREKEVSVQRAKVSLERRLDSIPIESPLVMTCDGRYYALHGGSLWTSTRRLSGEQWAGLITHVVSREDAKLASLAAGNGPDGDPKIGRSAIPSHVRIEVWRRDTGRCVRCGSRDRLEFDHIIPFAHGGSSTARNIELLCEACNRAKSASIS